MSAIHQFLHDLRWLVLLLTLPTGLYFSWKFWLAVNMPAATQPRTGQIRRTPARPAGSPSTGVQTNLLDKTTAASTAVGEASRRAKAQEQTLRIGPGDVRPDTAPANTTDLLPGRKTDKVDDEVNQLFAGLDDRLEPTAKTPPPPPKAVQERVTRLEELGFHHSIPKEQVRPTEAPLDTKPAPPRPSEVPPPPQLDDILARLDRVLGEDDAKPESDANATPAAPSAPAAPPTPAAPPAPPTSPLAKTEIIAAAPPPPPKAPAWARSDVTDDELDTSADKDDKDPGRQLGLFDRQTDGGTKPDQT